MSLPDAWVNRIFQKLTLTYGQSFLRQYDGVPMETVDGMPGVKANWAHELSCFQQNPDAIRYGLEYLPPAKAPTVLEFRDLCRKAPAPAPLAIDGPKVEADPAVVAKAKQAVRSNASTGTREWARKLKAREEQGTGLTPFQRAAWREALGVAA